MKKRKKVKRNSQQDDESKSLKKKLKEYKPICNGQCDSRANIKGTEPCYIDLYKTMDKLDYLWEVLLNTDLK